ncbi:hypothetical protein R3P38DRAFT_3488882 [Favolaschia claudopus]|uniref:Uncharacterized protein n=1 Tax=Favolaschia claudopus TaxID=2862362 RepID=A0AAW0EA60_9AGAR
MSGTIIPTYYAVCSSRYQPGRLPALPVPPQAPTVERQQRVKKRNGKPAQRRLPEGYVFIPPPNPLNFPPTYHFIEAGPLNERSKPERSVLGALTNIADRVLPKRNKEPEVDLADESFSCCGMAQVLWQKQNYSLDNHSQAKTTVLGSGMRSVYQFGMRDGSGVWFRIAGFSSTSDTDGGGAELLVGSVPLGFLFRLSRRLDPGDTDGGGAGLLVGPVLNLFLVFLA